MCRHTGARRAFSRYTSEQGDIDTYIENLDFCPGTRAPSAVDLPSGGAKGNADRHQRMSTSHQVRVACVMQRNPLTTRPLSDFEEAYHAFQISKQESLSRGLFDISSSNNGAGIRASASLAGNRRERRDSARDEQLPPAEESECELDGGGPALLRRGGELAESDLKRRVERKLYFVVCNELGRWVFPSYDVNPTSRAALHTLASGSLHRALGGSFELYPVGKSPVAVHVEVLGDRTQPPFGTKVGVAATGLPRASPHPTIRRGRPPIVPCAVLTHGLSLAHRHSFFAPS